MKPKQEVRRLLLERGLTAIEIDEELNGRLTFASIRRYMHDLIKEFSPEEMAAFTKARAAKPSRIKKARGLNRPTISPTHVRVGAQLSWHRSRMDLTPEEYVDRYGLTTRQALRAMELGLYDFRLVELLQIADILEVPIERLVAPSIQAREMGIVG